MNEEKRTAIHKVLSRLESEGQLTPDRTIEEARNSKSPLHSEFTWDLKKAALMTWRSQARALISQFHITVVIHRQEYNVQEFVEAPRKAENEQGYVAFSRLRSQKDLAREFLDRELAIASAYVSKTSNYAKVLGLETQVEKVIKDIAALRVQIHQKTGKRKRTISPVAHR